MFELPGIVSDVKIFLEKRSDNLQIAGQSLLAKRNIALFCGGNSKTRKGTRLTRLVQKARKFHEKHLEKHRNCKETTRKVDRTMAVIGVMGPIFTLSQVIHIFVTRNVGGISVYTWIGYMAVSACWAVYGYFYKDKPLIIVNSLSFVVNSFIIAGFVLYH